MRTKFFKQLLTQLQEEQVFKGLIIEEAGRCITPVIIKSNNNQTIIIILVTGLVRNNTNKKNMDLLGT